jgi:hypothetical protein
VILNVAGTRAWVGCGWGLDEVRVVALGEVIPTPPVLRLFGVVRAVVVPAVRAGVDAVEPDCVVAARGVVTLFACGELLELLEEPPQPASRNKGISPKTNRRRLTLPA